MSDSLPKEPILSVEDASYLIDGKAILSGISLQFYPGTLTILVGPNGAGKSTLLAVLAGDLAGCRSCVTLNRKICPGGKRNLWLKSAL